MSDCARFEERIVEALEGELDDRALASHAAGCRTCQSTLRSYRLIQESYRGVPTADVAPEVAGRILAAARERRPAAQGARRRLLVAAAVLAAVLIPLFAWLSSAERDPDAELVQQGDAQRAAGELEGAEASYTQALASCSEDAHAAEVRHRLAALYEERGEPERALVQADLLLARDLGSALRRDVLFLRARVLEALGRPEQAIAAYRSVVTEFPDTASDVESRLRSLGIPPEELETLEALGYGGEGGE